MSFKEPSHVVVIGAGITGVTTVYSLIRQGHRVTVIDRHAYPAMETSYANGAQLSASNAEVWNSWSTLWKGIRWMDRAPGRGVRVVSSGSVGLVLSGPQRTAERVDCRSESASLQAACVDAAAPIHHFAQATTLRPVA